MGGPLSLLVFPSNAAFNLIHCWQSTETNIGHALATSIYTPKALSVCSIPVPKAGYVTSDDVDHGKPHPDPYLAGAKKCGVDPSKCMYSPGQPRLVPMLIVSAIILYAQALL